METRSLEDVGWKQGLTPLLITKCPGFRVGLGKLGRYLKRGGGTRMAASSWASGHASDPGSKHLTAYAQ